MGNRGHKRIDTVEDLPPPADKRACNAPTEEEQNIDENTPTTSVQAQPSSASGDYYDEDDDMAEDATSVNEDSDPDSDDDEDEPAAAQEGNGDQGQRAQRGHDKFRNFLEAAGNLTEDASQKLVFLTELCETLSLCDELSISGKTAGTLSPSLVRLSREEMIPDISLLAVRAMTYLCDLIPRSSGFLVRDDAVSVLCQKLMAIEDMDVAEQCLQALEKISREQPLACLQGGAIMAVLSYLDFFSTTTQRVALSTVMNICKKLPSELTAPFMDAVPILCNLLQYEDVKVVEIAAGCLIKITDRVRRSPALLDKLCNHGIIHPIFNLLSSNNRTALPQQIYNGLLGLLAKLSSGSFSAFKILYELNIGSVLKGILSTMDVSHDMIDTQSNKIHGALNLLDQLIPSSIVDLNSSESSEKEAFLHINTELLRNLARDNLPLLIQVANSGATTYICYGGLSIIKKLIHWCEPDTLVDSLRSANISSFLAGVLTRKDQHVLLLALQTSDLILQNFPDEFSHSFVKEGVFFSIDALLKLPRVSPEVSSQSEAPEKSSSVPRCLCHSFGPKRNSCKLGKDFYSVHSLAKSIRSAHLTAESGETSSTILQELTALSKALSDMVSTSDQDDDDNDKYCGVLQKIIAKLVGEKKEDPISTFEFVESGIVRSLTDFLTSCHNREYGEAFIPGKRFDVFVRLFLPSPPNSPPLSTLVQKLQKALSASENFSPFLNSASKMKESSEFQSGRSSTRLPWLRVRFLRGEGETSLQDYYKDKYVRVNPLSTVMAVEGLLWPKVNGESQKEAKRAEETGSNESDDSMSDDEDVEEEGPKLDSPPKLVFFLDGQQLNRQWTLYQAILEKQMKEEEESVTASQKMWWTHGHTLTYRRRSEEENENENQPNDQISCVFRNQPGPTNDILRLLTLLEYANEISFSIGTRDKLRAFAEEKLDDLDALRIESAKPFVARSEFVNAKLTEKLEQQMRDPMAVSLDGIPLWCGQLMASAPIVFGFESKNKYFRLASFGASTHFHVQDNTHYSAGASRRKFSVSRSDVLGSAARMMETHAGQKVSLEVEYIDEVGTGLGPTLEFYTLISREFQRTGMQMWRDDHESFNASEFVASPLGLFPRPWSSSAEKIRGVEFGEVTKKFLLLGQTVAKALQDGRVLDISLSKAFYKLMLGQELCVFDIVSFDPGLARTLLEFKALVDRKFYVEESTKQEISLIEYGSWFRGTRIEDLCLDFTLPGYPEFLLSSELEHEHETVTMSNLDDYMFFVLDATLRSGISKQVEAFKSGFNQVFPIENLRFFTEDELERVLCGEHGSWDVSDLIGNVKIDHGYTSSSTPIIHLFEIIRDFDANERRAFLQFVTGAPRLPLGGFKSLSPTLTIVRKLSTVGSVDSDLPSVMTCANYLKLPSYSTKETMREKIIYAITEGQGSFHLS